MLGTGIAARFFRYLDEARIIAASRDLHRHVSDTLHQNPTKTQKRQANDHFAYKFW